MNNRMCIRHCKLMQLEKRLNAVDFFFCFVYCVCVGGGGRWLSFAEQNYFARCTAEGHVDGTFTCTNTFCLCLN